MKPGYFIINGISSETLNVVIQERPDIPAPKRRVSFVSPVSYEGELAYDDDGYEPTEFELKCFYDGRSHGDVNQDISTARNKIYTLFNQGIGEWIPFIPYFDEQHIYNIILTEMVFENKYYYDGCISFTAKLKCQPYKYLKDISPYRISNGEYITNPTLYNSKPVISFSGVKGRISITIGSTTMMFKDLNNENVFIDCEAYATYSKDGRNIRNLNNRTIGKDFFELSPGSSKNTVVISKSTDGTSDMALPILTIKPNWRVLV